MLNFATVIIGGIFSSVDPFFLGYVVTVGTTFFLNNTLHDVQCYGNNTITFYICGLNLKKSVSHSPSEASQLNSITTALDSLSDGFKKLFFFSRGGTAVGENSC